MQSAYRLDLSVRDREIIYRGLVFPFCLQHMFSCNIYIVIHIFFYSNIHRESNYTNAGKTGGGYIGGETQRDKITYTH